MNELDVARRAARAAADIQRKYVDVRPADVRIKSGAIDLVTEVDRACEDAVREVFARETPGIPVLGEERGGERGAATRWVVDPLDGTTNFVHGFPFFCVSIALVTDGKSEVGVVIDAVRDREYAARRGGGVTCNGVPQRVSDVRELGSALLGSGFPYDRQRLAHEYLAYWDAFLRRTHGVRRAGAAALDLSLVSEGRLDAFWEFHLSLWDVAAGTLFVEEAGGTVTALDGGALDPADPCPLASNGHLHPAVLDVLAEVRARVSSGHPFE